MRLLVCGSRHVCDADVVAEAFSRIDLSLVDEVVVGDCRGVDTVARHFARSRGIRVTKFVADWDTYGRNAGPIRNSTMVAYSDCVLALPCTRSIGTWDTIRKARASGMVVVVVEVSE